MLDKLIFVITVKLHEQEHVHWPLKWTLILKKEIWEGVKLINEVNVKRPALPYLKFSTTVGFRDAYLTPDIICLAQLETSCSTERNML